MRPFVKLMRYGKRQLDGASVNFDYAALLLNFVTNLDLQLVCRRGIGSYVILFKENESVLCCVIKTTQKKTLSPCLLL